MPLQKSKAAGHERASQNFENKFPTVLLSAVYHLLGAAANLTGVACVFPLPHTPHTQSGPGHMYVGMRTQCCAPGKRQLH